MLELPTCSCPKSLWSSTFSRLLFGARTGNNWREWNLLRAGRKFRREYRLGDARREIPIGEHRAELRLRGLRFVADHQFPGCRLRPCVDPDLPVYVLFHESQRVAAS